MDNEGFAYNAKGAKVYNDPLRHEILDIPRLNSTDERGAIYEVLSVGIYPNLGIPDVTVKKDGKAILYRLPDWYLGWAKGCIRLSSQNGRSMFPSLVEFGYLVPERKYFAEIL